MTILKECTYGACGCSSLSALSATVPRSGTLFPPVDACLVDESPSSSTLASTAVLAGAPPVYVPWDDSLEHGDVTYYSYYTDPADQP